MNDADIVGIALLLALGAATLAIAFGRHRRTARALHARNLAVVQAAFGPRLARGHRPPADGRWHRVLREIQHGEDHGPGEPSLQVSELWLVDSEGRQWHSVVRCGHDGAPQARHVRFAPAAQPSASWQP